MNAMADASKNVKVVVDSAVSASEVEIDEDAQQELLGKQTKNPLPVTNGLILDLIGSDYAGGMTWKSRVGNVEAVVPTSLKTHFNKTEKASRSLTTSYPYTTTYPN